MRVETRELKTIAQCVECQARMLSDGILIHWPECSQNPEPMQTAEAKGFKVE